MITIEICIYYYNDIILQPCRTFLQQTDVQFMFSEMITKSQQQYLV